MATPIDIIGGFYTVDGRSWAAQDCVNYLPMAAEVSGTKTRTSLRTPPGLRPYVEIGDGPEYAIRGGHDVEGRRFVVAGQRLYQISNTGIAIPLGTVPGVGRVSMAHNQIAGGNELLVVNGNAGYVWNTLKQTFTRVTDPGYPGAFLADFVDSYLMQVEPFGRYLFHSDLANASEYNTLDRFEAEAEPDRIVSMLVDHGEVWAFGVRTIQLFQNTGAAQGTFQPKGITIEQGCAGRFTPAKLDNSVFWLGNDGIFYRADGYSPMRISTHAIEDAIADCDWSQAFAFTWASKGHKVYYCTFPDGQTWGYDVSSRLWHRRASYHPVHEVARRWRLSDLFYSNGEWIGCDSTSGKLFILDWDYVLEGEAEPLVSERTTQIAYSAGRAFSVDMLELEMLTGQKATVPGSVVFPIQPEGPTITGDAPDGYIGEPYSFQYTITEGDAPVVAVTATALPPGLTLSNTGLLSGTLTAAGVTSFRVRVRDSNGLWDEVSDQIRVGSAWALMRIGNTPDQNVWLSGNPLAWPNLNQFAPFVPTIGSATCNSGPLALTVVSDLTGDGVRTTLPPAAGVLTTTNISVGSPVRRIRRIGDLSFAFGTDSATYYYKEGIDGEWVPVTIPGGLHIWDIVRLDSGRWVSYRGLSSISEFIYSDQDIPTTWTVSESLSGRRDYAMACDGKTIMAMGSASRFYRSTNGTSWEILGGGVGVPDYVDVRDAVAAGGAFVFVGQSPGEGLGNIAATYDNGVTWQRITIPQLNVILRIEVDGDTWVASGAGNVTPSESLVFVSTDRGQTWTPSEMPFTPGSSATAIAVCIKP